jgi:polyhydroxyalkanoate synthesis repressor PhaR
MEKMAQTTVIRKYPNRRLYDTSAGRYVNLEEVAGLVRRGTPIQVLDVRSGEDVTRVVLTQIIVEDAKGRPAGLPLELLRQLIMATDRAGQEFLMWYLQSAFDAYRKVQESVQTRLSDVQSAAFSPLGIVRSLLGPPAPQDGGDVEELRRRIAELETQLVAQPRPARAKKARVKKNTRG